MVKKEELTKALADTFDPKQKAQILKEIIALKDKEIIYKKKEKCNCSII